MDSFFYLSKFELKMKIDICISAKLAFKLCYSGVGVKDFKKKNCIICLVCKSAEKVDYLKYIVAYLCSINNEYSISIHLFYGWFQLLTLSSRMVAKSSTHIHNPEVEKCRFKFLCHFGTTSHERASKIHVHGLLLGPARNY